MLDKDVGDEEESDDDHVQAVIRIIAVEGVDYLQNRNTPVLSSFYITNTNAGFMFMVQVICL